MIFPRLMIQKRFLYSDKIYNYSSISNKLSFGLTTIFVEETLFYFFLLDIDLFFLVIGPAGCDSRQKKLSSFVFRLLLKLKVHCISSWSSTKRLQESERLWRFHLSYRGKHDKKGSVKYSIHCCFATYLPASLPVFSGKPTQAHTRGYSHQTKNL